MSSVKLPAPLTAAFSGEEDGREQGKWCMQLNLEAGAGPQCFLHRIFSQHTTVCESVKTCHELRTAQRR